MATYVTLPSGKVKAIVRKAGVKTVCRTRPTLKAAKEWAIGIERNIDATGTTDYASLRKATVGGVLREYQAQEIPKHKSYKQEHAVCSMLMRESFAHLRLCDDVAGALRTYRDKRLAEGAAPGTVIKHLKLVSGAFSWAISEKNLKLPVNPAKQVKHPGNTGAGRTRIWSDADLDIWLKHYKFNPDVAPTTGRDMMPWLLQIARYTGLRLGELCKITNQTPAQAERQPNPLDRGYIDLSEPEIYFPAMVVSNDGTKLGGTKNDDGFHCPLTAKAPWLVGRLMELTSHLNLHQEPGDAPPTLFRTTPERVGRLFRIARAEIAKEHPDHANIVTHELRHTFTTELVEWMGVDEQLTILAVTGRRSVASLKGYFHPKPSSLAKKVEAARKKALAEAALPR